MSMHQNLGELILETADTHGKEVALQIRRGFRLERLTFRETGLQARQVAGWLAARGLQPGDRLAVWAPNMPEYAVLYFGAWIAGVVMVPIDVRTEPDVLGRFVASARPRLAFKSRFLEASFGSPVEETLALEDLFDLVRDAPPVTRPPKLTGDALCEIAFTSGTTGTPKGVMLTHGNLLAEIEGLLIGFPLQPRYRALSVLPLSHALEQVISLLLAFRCGLSVSYAPRVNAVTVARTLRDDRITCLVVVPELLRLMLTAIERQARREGQWERYQLAHRLAGRLPFSLRRLLFRRVHQQLGGSLEFFGCGGAPLNPSLAEAWERMGVNVFEGYGLTETSAAAAINAQGAKRLGSVGKPLPGVDVRIGEGHEVQIRGKTVTPGYLDNAELTEEAFADGWFRTGDIGELDDDGFLRILGRESFKIVLPDGRNVYPEDIERELNKHPLMQDSCVVGLERDGGERVHAVLLTDSPEQADAIVRETNGRLGSHEQISSHSVWQDEDFPRTATLKIDRDEVRSAVQHSGRPREPGPEKAAPSGDPLAAAVAQVAGRSSQPVRDDDQLEADLGLDSLGRVELLAVIEEEIGRVVDETRVRSQTTVGELRVVVAEGTAGGQEVAPARWPRAWWARGLRRALLWLVFRIQDRWMRIEVVHYERAEALPLPSILIFNYEGPYVPLVMLRALPPRVRERVAVGADARLWEGKGWWQGVLAALAAQAFPFTKSGGAVRGSLDELGRWLDDGYAVIMSPEGDPELGRGLLPFLRGTGLMAVEMQVPIIPFRVEGYGRLFLREPQFPYLPIKRGRVRLIIGEPITVSKTTSYEDATELARQALIEAH
jgi:long-chain acyl-CoA synthetase